MAKNTRTGTLPTNSLLDPVTQYAIAVTSGQEIAGPLVRLACQRHLDDRATGAARGLTWKWPSAKRVIEFFSSVLRLSGGAYDGHPFRLHPSQQFIVGSLFGWKGADGYRRFRVAYVEEGKGNGKSPLAAGIGLYMMCADGESAAEVYAAATDKDQARILFRDAVAMVNGSPALSRRLQRSGGAGREWNLAYLEQGSFFRPISSESFGRGKSGPRVHCALLDEVHEHPTNAMVEMLRAGTKGRRQALIFMITNSGVIDERSVCWHYHQYAESILNKHESNDAFFAYVCGLDRGDSWQNPGVWRKANPLLGISISEKYLTEQVREASGMPAKQALVRRLNFCEWVEASNPWIAPQVWDACEGAIDITALRGRSCYAALDLSSKNDLSCLALLFDLDHDTVAVLLWSWCPEQGLRERGERDRVDYRTWVEAGWLTTTPGPVVGYDWIATQIGELASIYQIKVLAYDKWHIDHFKRELDKVGVALNVVEWEQGFRGMTPAIQAAEDLIKTGRLRHRNPVLSWCVHNVQVISDPAGNRKFDKKRAAGRIDGAQVLAMACGLRALAPPDPGPSIYETDDVLIL